MSYFVIDGLVYVEDSKNTVKALNHWRT